MDEYIKRECAIEAVKHALEKGLDPSQYLEIIPAAEVSPVRHGRWIEYIEIGAMNNHYECSACHWKTPSFTIARDSNFCPNCGAKMDGGFDNG